MFTEEELIQEDGYWTEKIENVLYNNRDNSIVIVNREMIKEILLLKSKLTNTLNEEA
jgi:hypothetical protein